MQYSELGREYLSEAEVIGRRIERLREKINSDDISREAQFRLYKDLSMLKEMYMECSITGRRLSERGYKWAE